MVILANGFQLSTVNVAKKIWLLFRPGPRPEPWRRSPPLTSREPGLAWTAAYAAEHFCADGGPEHE